jgi:hypothetical protein
MQNRTTKDHSLPSASLVQNGLLSAALSVEEGNILIAGFLLLLRWNLKTFSPQVSQIELQIIN